MRPKERVLAAINHEVPDRVPIDLGSTVNSSMVKESYERLREFIGFKPKNSELLSRMMRTSRIHNDVHDYLDTDLRGVFPGSLGTKEWLDENTYRGPRGITRRKTLNYRTPHEVYCGTTESLTVALST